MASKDTELSPTRITILDAHELDSEVYSIFKNQLSTILSHLPAQVSYLEPELQTLLKTILWVLSVQRTSATFGQQLLKVKYSKQVSPKNLKIFGFILIGSSYLKERLPLFMSLFRWEPENNFAFKLIEWCELTTSVFNIIYFVKFIRQGGSSTFLEFILGLKPVSKVPSSNRNVGYSYMTKELIWHGLIELLVLGLPMINYHALKRVLRNNTMFSSTQSKSVQEFDNLKCAVCKDYLILPHHMGCSHLFCYYCLVSHRMADKKFECPTCGYSNPDAPVIPVSSKW